MPGHKIFNEKDDNGRWWKFNEQNRDCSCGPASVKIVKEYFHNTSIGEDAIRGLLGSIINPIEDRSLLEADIDTCAIWDRDGTIENVVLSALHKNPYPITQAKMVQGIDPLRKCSRNHPSILGFNWDGGGGHFVVCVGPVTAVSDRFVILDPWFGLQYLEWTPAHGDELIYTPKGEATKSTIDNAGYIVTT